MRKTTDDESHDFNKQTSAHSGAIEIENSKKLVLSLLDGPTNNIELAASRTPQSELLIQLLEGPTTDPLSEFWSRIPKVHDYASHRELTLGISPVETTIDITHVEWVTPANQNHIDDILVGRMLARIQATRSLLEWLLFWGNSDLAPDGQQRSQFSGLDALIHKDRTIDLKGEDLNNDYLYHAAALIGQDGGTLTDLFLPSEVRKNFAPASSEIVLANRHTAKLWSSPFLTKTKLLPSAGLGFAGAPPAPQSVSYKLTNETSADFTKSGAGSYSYSVTACNQHGESLAVEGDTPITLGEADLDKGIKLTIRNADDPAIAPEWFNIYRSERDGTKKYLIMRVPAKSTLPGAETIAVDTNSVMPNTYTAFVGQLSPDVIEFIQQTQPLILRLDAEESKLSWKIMLWGELMLHKPERWVKLTNIRSHWGSDAIVGR